MPYIAKCVNSTIYGIICCLAERTGFEPAVPVTAHPLSKRAH